MRDAGPGTRDVGRGTWDVGRGTRDTGHGTRDTGHGTRDTGYGTRDTGRGTRDAGCAMRRGSHIAHRSHQDVQNVSTLRNILCSQPIVVASEIIPTPACSMRAFATLLDAT